MIIMLGKVKADRLRTRYVLGIGFLLISLAVGGGISCKKEVAEKAAPLGEGEQVVKKGINEFESTVAVGVGKYMYMPGAQGIDMIVQGAVESGDASSLVGKEVRVKGDFSPERPSLLTVESIEVKEGERRWRNVFTRTEQVVLEDYIGLMEREGFEVLRELDYRKAEEWEGKGKVKVFGKLEKVAVKEGGEEKDVYTISALEGGKESGKILVDTITDYAKYYLKKLRLFDEFWFYLGVKDTVDWKTRRSSKELFHADLLFQGLF